MTEKTLRSFSLVLHSHSETYIPLLQELNKLVDDRYHPKLKIGLTSVLCEKFSQILKNDGKM